MNTPRLDATAGWPTSVRLLCAYTLAVLWHERPRYLSAVLAVAFCAALINLQWGLVLGIYAATSIPVDHADADVWVGAPGVTSVDTGRRLSHFHLSRVASQPEVALAEPLVLDYASWVRPDGTKENCLIIGSRLCDNALGAVRDLTAEQRVLLAEPGAVAIDWADRDRLGVCNTGDTAEVLGQRVRVVGWLQGLKGLNVPYIFCSLETARQLLGFLPDQATYFLARCRPSADLTALVGRLDAYGDLSAYSNDDFALQTRLFWLTQTPGGLVTAFMAFLSLLVGAVVTSQTLYAATIASLREYALLRALGISRRRLAAFVLSQSLGVGLAGVLLALPLIFVLDLAARLLVGTHMILPWWLLLLVLVTTVLMALFSGLATLRSLRLMEPITLLR